MKKLQLEILETYKAYQKDSSYTLEGDMIVLSGINGSGKSQLLRIIAKQGNEQIIRTVNQINDDGTSIAIENILLLSFRDNIDLGNNFGEFSVTFHKDYLAKAWEFYTHNIMHTKNNTFINEKRTKKYNNNTLIFDDDGIKNPSWRSIFKLTDILKSNFNDDKVFNLSQSELENVLPIDFVWRNENDIVQLISNLFYMACCDRNDEQIKFSESTSIFDNNEWLKTAPWTILNKLFSELNFKYKFKDDYTFKTPYMNENPQLMCENEIRSLIGLSDGEKAILKLALISLDETISKDVKLILFDEYDAPLNPSLIEAFYSVITKFYIERGIQVVLTTHSPSTLSLAPDYTRFYEIFTQDTGSPKVIEVNRYDYEELRKANKIFYDKIKNQTERIAELEYIATQNGKLLFVEDKYDQIYKIAYLKLKGIENLSIVGLEQKFSENASFQIHGNFSSGGLYGILSCPNISRDQNCKIVCLFDFDGEGYGKFKKITNLKQNVTRIFSEKKGTLKTGLYLKHNQIDKYALMLPIPERLEKYISEKTSADCFIEVETLISENYLINNPKAEQRSMALPFYKLKDVHKKDFWEDLISADKECFLDFKPLFDRVEELLNC